MLLKLCKTYSDWSGEALVSCMDGLLPNVSITELKVKTDSLFLYTLQIGFIILSFERSVSLIRLIEKLLSGTVSLFLSEVKRMKYCHL